ncbi:MAG: sulfite exporter TauE/SafE family protein [Gammaproteobacteria bacterium]|nr:sulfite exporter TauE/SafE family protein [Gammaproteobacteria bacterium]
MFRNSVVDAGSLSIGLVVFVFVAISVGALLKGMTGVGLPLVAVPAIASITTVEEAVILMIIPVMGSNLWLLVTYGKYRAMIREHLPFLVAGFLGGIVGTLLLVTLDDRLLKLVLAAWLALYLIQYVSGDVLHFIFRAKGAAAALVGAAAGTAHGASGISVHIVGPYFHGRGLGPGPYAFLVAVAFLTTSSAQLVTALSNQLLTADRLAVALLALLPTLFFTRVGVRYAGAISERLFNRILITLFVVMEIKLLADVF